jgi:hypothetical protein
LLDSQQAAVEVSEQPFDLLASGNVQDVNLIFDIKQPNTLLTSPLFAFTSPVTSLEALERSFQLVTGVNVNLARHIGLKPLGFQLMRLQLSKNFKSNTVVVSAGWPDISGGMILSSPCLADVDRTGILQMSLISQLADCTVAVVDRLTRSEILFLTKFLKKQKRAIVWHVTEEFENQRDLIEEMCNGTVLDQESNIIHHCSPDAKTIPFLEKMSQELSISSCQKPNDQLTCNHLLQKSIERALHESCLLDEYQLACPDVRDGQALISVFRKQMSIQH